MVNNYNKVLSLQEVQTVMEILGVDIAKCEELKYAWEKEGHRVRSFILPQPTLFIRGIRVIFADINQPTVETHNRR